MRAQTRSEHKAKPQQENKTEKKPTNQTKKTGVHGAARSSADAGRRTRRAHPAPLPHPAPHTAHTEGYQHQGFSCFFFLRPMTTEHATYAEKKNNNNKKTIGRPSSPPSRSARSRGRADPSRHKMAATHLLARPPPSSQRAPRCGGKGGCPRDWLRARAVPACLWAGAAILCQPQSRAAGDAGGLRSCLR